MLCLGKYIRISGKRIIRVRGDNYHNKYTLIINQLGIYKVNWKNKMLPVATSCHVFVSETYPNMSNLKKVTSQIVFVFI